MKNFLLLDLGLSIAIPTIIIPALTGLNPEANPNEKIHVTAVQASWLGTYYAYMWKSESLKKNKHLKKTSSCSKSGVYLPAVGKRCVWVDYGTDWP